MEPNFTTSFLPNSLDEVLAPSTVFSLELTQVINRTAPLDSDGLSTYSGIWLSAFNVEADQLFHGETRYTYYRRTYTNITIIIDQSLFYVSNVQEPIARQTEVTFHSFLFTNVILELFGLLFLLNKLIIIPAFQKIVARIKNRHPKNQNTIITEDLTNVIVNDNKSLEIFRTITSIKSYRRSSDVTHTTALSAENEHYITK